MQAVKVAQLMSVMLQILGVSGSTNACEPHVPMLKDIIICVEATVEHVTELA